MALGKITIVIGAGILGSILSKEGGLSDVTAFFTNAFKIATKHLQYDNSGPRSTAKPRNDTLLAQVNNLRQELQLLASSRSVTIVTSTRSGNRAYGVTAVIIVGFVGYGYIWWKGWKLSDMIFVTRSGFSNACAGVGKQLEHVYTSIRAAKRHLSSKIDVLDNSLDEMKDLNAATKGEVMQLHGDIDVIHLDVDSVNLAVKNLESKIDQLDYGQNFAGRGLYALCKFVEGWQQSMKTISNQESPSSSQRSMEPPLVSGISRTGSLPPLSLEPPSPSYPTDSPKVLRSVTTVSAAGLKELQEISNSIRPPSLKTSPRNTPDLSQPSADEPSSSSSGRFSWKIPVMSVLTRTKSTAS